MRKVIFIVCAICTGAAFSQQQGETQETKKLKNVLVKGKKQKYQPVKKSSTSLRLPTELKKVPQNIQVISKAVFEDQNAFTMYDNVIRNVSGLNRVGHWQNFARINARGQRATALRNGANVAVSFWAPLTEDLAVVERIEFVKGPAGFMLANGETGGLYNVVTKKPTGQNRKSITVALGSFENYRAAFDLDGLASKDGKLQYRFNAVGNLNGSHRKNEFMNSYTIAPVLKYVFNENTSATLEYNEQHNEMAAIGSNYSFSKKGYGKNGDTPMNFSTAEPNFKPSTVTERNVFFILNHKINKNWNVNAQVSYLNHMQEGQSLWAASLSDKHTMQRTITVWDAFGTAKNGQFFVDGMIDQDFLKHKILFGLDMSHKKYSADWNQRNNLGDANFDLSEPKYGTVKAADLPVWKREKSLEERGVRYVNNNYTGFYIQDELSFMQDKLRLTLAGRYTHNKNINPYQSTEAENGKFTPRVGLGVSVTENTNVYGLVDQIFIGNFGTDYKGNTFDPMTGTNLELGVKQSFFGGKLSANLAIYQTTKSNVLTRDDENADEKGNFTYQRTTGEAQTQGLELDVMGEVLPGVSVILNYAYTDGKVTKDTDEKKVGKPLQGNIKHIQNTWLNYQILNTGFQISLGYNAQLGRVYEEIKDVQNPANYYRMDAGIGYTYKNFRANLTVNNLTNRFLYVGGYSTWGKYYYYQTEPGRNFRVSLAYTF